MEASLCLEGAWRGPEMGPEEITGLSRSQRTSVWLGSHLTFRLTLSCLFTRHPPTPTRCFGLRVLCRALSHLTPPWATSHPPQLIPESAPLSRHIESLILLSSPALSLLRRLTRSTFLLGKQQQKINKDSRGEIYSEGFWLVWLQVEIFANQTKKGLGRRTSWHRLFVSVL